LRIHYQIECLTYNNQTGSNHEHCVCFDCCRYHNYYEASTNIILDVERKTNPDATDERFPTSEVFKTEIIPGIIARVNGMFDRGFPSARTVQQRLEPPSPPSEPPTAILSSEPETATEGYMIR